MMRGARTVRRAHFAMMRSASAKCSRARATTCSQACAEARMRQHGGRLGAEDAGGLQRLARQIEPPDRRVLVDVAQDVGELQRAAEMIGEAMPAFSSMPKTRTESRPTALATRSQ